MSRADICEHQCGRLGTISNLPVWGQNSYKGERENESYLPRVTSSVWHTVHPRLRTAPGSWSPTRLLAAPWASAAPAASSWSRLHGWPRRVGHVWRHGASCWPWFLPPRLQRRPSQKTLTQRWAGVAEVAWWGLTACGQTGNVTDLRSKVKKDKGKQD